ncbi:hypothetical protein [uncultured Flavobacterium sp.]|uniref:hypothetical protein n=1 Tax=uncultured Flavobacterium sp. TaxID=165435 RepID=UPI0030ED6B96|tara:strand:- start:5964 stop:6413 length:450 start_codon:yes stop_codon:yes gene_type:complete
MNSKTLAFILFFLFLFSCDKADDCPEASTGPPYFFVEIVDSTTNENVFTNGTYTENQLSVSTAPATNTNSYFFIAQDNANIIQIIPSWSEGTFTTTITLDNQISIPIVSEVYKSETRCTTNYFLKSVTVQGFEYEVETENGFYKIKIDN